MRASRIYTRQGRRRKWLALGTRREEVAHRVAQLAQTSGVSGAEL